MIPVALLAKQSVLERPRGRRPRRGRVAAWTVDFVGNKAVFDIGGNKFRLIAVIDYENHKVFIRDVLTHKDYDKGQWKKDSFGEDWVRLPPPQTADQDVPKKKGRRNRSNT